MQNSLKVIFIGDIIGKAGRNALQKGILDLKDFYFPDFMIANGENLAGGFGITKKTTDFIFSLGINCITSGNHIWDNKEYVELLSDERILRPLNYHKDLPGKGTKVFMVKGIELEVINLCGRVFMQPLDCPFKTIDEHLKDKKEMIRIVDFHAEATAEKQSFGFYLDGKVSAVIGTHTHCQTADERILENGTGFITDVGMTGSFDSVIGFEKEGALKRTIYQIPQRFEVAKKNLVINGLFLEIGVSDFKTLKIERIFKYVSD
ncbi:MAG: TIGR00282 family metallophosphoesterase [candidate division WOR-3 bacterium]